MKKLLCVLLLLCLLVPAALAEETATLNWEDVVPVLVVVPRKRQRETTRPSVKPDVALIDSSRKQVKVRPSKTQLVATPSRQTKALGVSSE